VCVKDSLFSVHITVIYKSQVNKKKLEEISTKIFFVMPAYNFFYSSYKVTVFTLPMKMFPNKCTA